MAIPRTRGDVPPITVLEAIDGPNTQYSLLDTPQNALTNLRQLQGDHPYPTGPLATQQAVYDSYAGVDIVAQIVLPNNKTVTLGELQTLSYSIHRENTPVRFLGHVNPSGFVKGPRTIAGSLIFTVFNYYAFYRVQQFQESVNVGLYPVADMMPPFDIVLTFANETGAMSKMKIYGVTIVDEGGTMSIDDLITEQTYSYMARGIQPLLGYDGGNSVNSVDLDQPHTLSFGG